MLFLLLTDILFTKNLKKIKSNDDNLLKELKNSLIVLSDDLKSANGLCGVQFINIEINNNDKIIALDCNQRRKIQSTHKKQIYHFIDDEQDDEQKKVHNNNRLMKEFRRINKNNGKWNEQSVKLDKRYNDLLQFGGKLLLKNPII